MTKIFIVEDDEIIVKAIKIALEKEFQVRSVSNFRAVKQESFPKFLLSLFLRHRMT